MGRVRSALLSFLVAAVALAASAEFLSFLYVRHVARLDWGPAWLAGPAEPQRDAGFLIDTAPWGIWRRANATSRFESACFAQTLAANAFGMNDVPREKQAGGRRRVVVLGDSFAEGWGVAREARVSNILERELGMEFLNFAIASAGPLQYQMIYELLAADFAHDAVLVMLLPGNDFTDNDAETWRRKPNRDFHQRHRRYYAQRADGGYDVIDPTREEGAQGAAPEAVRGIDRRAERGWLNRLEKTVRDNLWLHRAIDHIKTLWGIGAGYSGYDDYTDAQFNAVVWSLRQIKARAGGRPVSVAIAPRLNDFLRAARGGATRLPPALTAALAADGIDVIDLLGPMRRAAPDPTALFIPCDGHWTEAGNRLAAQALLAANPFTNR
jgi:hypothetical protein